MTRTPGASAALNCIIAPWAAKIVAVLGAIVETILAIAENIRNTLPELGACCRKAGRRFLALRPGLSRPMMSKPGFMPPSASALHALACKRSREFGQAAMKDLNGTSEAWIKGQFAEPLAIEPWRWLTAILTWPELNDDSGSERRACPHVKKSTRGLADWVNPWSATAHQRPLSNERFHLYFNVLSAVMRLAGGARPSLTSTVIELTFTASLLT